MKKFIEALKEAGIYDHIVETIVDVRNRYGAKDATKGITMIGQQVLTQQVLMQVQQVQ